VCLESQEGKSGEEASLSNKVPVVRAWTEAPLANQGRMCEASAADDRLTHKGASTDESSNRMLKGELVRYKIRLDASWVGDSRNPSPLCWMPRVPQVASLGLATGC